MIETPNHAGLEMSAFRLERGGSLSVGHRDDSLSQDYGIRPRCLGGFGLRAALRIEPAPE